MKCLWDDSSCIILRMYKKNLTLLFLVVFGVRFCFSQQKDTIILTNGNLVVEQVIDTLLGSVTAIDSKHPKKKLHHEFDDVYGVFYSSGSKKYFYVQDTARYLWFSRDEMGYFVRGERDARKGFKASGSLIGGGLT